MDSLVDLDAALLAAPLLCDVSDDIDIADSGVDLHGHVEPTDMLLGSEHIALPQALAVVAAPKPKIEKNSIESTAHARGVRTSQVLKRKLAALSSEKNVTRFCCAGVARRFSRRAANHWKVWCVHFRSQAETIAAWGF